MTCRRGPLFEGDDFRRRHTPLPLHSTTDFRSALARITRDAQAVADWARSNGLTLNSGKTKVIIVGSVAYTRHLDLASLPCVVIDGCSLPYVIEARSLSVNFTSTLNWHIHTKQVTLRVFGSLYSLRFFRHALSRDLRKHLAESLLFPHFDYAAPVYNHLDKTRVIKLENTLKACVRFVVGNIPRHDHVTPHRLALGWLSAARTIPVDRFACRLNIDLEVGRSNRRPPQPFEPPPRRTEAFKHSFALEALDLLNSINFTSFTPGHLPLLKRTLRDALFNRDVADWNAHLSNEGLPTRLLFRTQTPLTQLRARL